MSKKQELEIPRVLFFDIYGYSISYRDPKHLCSRDAYFFIKDYSKNKELSYDKNINIENFSSSFINVKSGKKNDFDEKEKIYCFINWAIFTDNYNKESFDLLDLGNDNFVFYLVNLDIQKSWNIKN